MEQRGIGRCGVWRLGDGGVDAVFGDEFERGAQEGGIGGVGFVWNQFEEGLVAAAGGVYGREGKARGRRGMLVGRQG